MKLTCKTNEAFEDQLTTDRQYSVQGLKNNSVYIVNDKGEPRWYGLIKFNVEVD